MIGGSLDQMWKVNRKGWLSLATLQSTLSLPKFRCVLLGYN